MKITAEIKITDPNVIQEAYNLHFKTNVSFFMRNKKIILGLIAILFGTYLVVLTRPFEANNQINFYLYILMIAAGCITIVTEGIRLLSMGKKVLKRYPELSEPKEFKFFNTNISITTKNQDISLKWSSYNKAIISNKFILLYHSLNEFVILPADCFDRNEYQILSDYIKTKIPETIVKNT